MENRSKRPEKKAEKKLFKSEKLHYHNISKSQEAEGADNREIRRVRTGNQSQGYSKGLVRTEVIGAG